MSMHYYDFQIPKTQPIDLAKLRVAINKLPFASAIGGIGMNRISRLLRFGVVQELDEEQEALLRDVVASHGTLPVEEAAEEGAEEEVYDGPAVRHLGARYEFLPSKAKPKPLSPSEPEEDAGPEEVVAPPSTEGADPIAD